MSKETKAKIMEMRKNLCDAEESLEKAVQEHRQAFREDLVKLFNEYELALVGCYDGELEICTVVGTYNIESLPR